jgi:hypothetical protein
MVDNLDRNAAGLRFVKRPRDIAVERCPGFFIDLCFKGGLERRVGIVGAQEIGVADEEAFFSSRIVSFEIPEAFRPGNLQTHPSHPTSCQASLADRCMISASHENPL